MTIQEILDILKVPSFRYSKKLKDVYLKYYPTIYEKLRDLPRTVSIKLDADVKKAFKNFDAYCKSIDTHYQSRTITELEDVCAKLCENIQNFLDNLNNDSKNKEILKLRELLYKKRKKIKSVIWIAIGLIAGLFVILGFLELFGIIEDYHISGILALSDFFIGTIAFIIDRISGSKLEDKIGSALSGNKETKDEFINYYSVKIKESVIISNNSGTVQVNKNHNVIIFGIVALVIVLVIVAILFFPAKNNQPNNSNTDTETPIIYSINEDGESLTACINSDSAKGDVSIPAEHKIDGKTYKVTVIGAATMSDNDKVNSINLPNTVERIGASAFKNFSHLKKVTLPESISYIGVGAFSGCVQLQQVNINNLTAWCNIDFGGEFSNPLYYATLNLNNEAVPGEIELDSSITAIPDYTFKNSNIVSIEMSDNVTYLGKDAFVGCSQLTTAILSKNLNEIFEGTFSGCGKLQTLEIPFIGGHSEAIEEDPSSLFGYIFGSTEYEDIEEFQQEFYFGSNQIKYCIPNSIAQITVYGDIPDFAFAKTPFSNDANNEDLGLLIEKVNLVETKKIGDYSFASCAKIEKLNISGSVTSIGGGAFYGCTNLESIIIPDSVTVIGNWAFCGCTRLANVTIGDGVTSIGRNAFSNCSNLTEATFKNSNGWKVSYSANNSNAQKITLGTPSENAILLKSTYSGGFWIRSD